MSKKRYLVVLSLAIASILFGSLYNVTFGGKPTPPPNQVEVTNFPLDEEGNLRTTVVQSSKIMLVYNQSLKLGSDVNRFTYLTTFNTSGFKYAYIMAKAQGTWSVGANIHIWFFDNNFGIQTLPYGIGYIQLDTGSETYKPSWGTGISSRYEVHSTTCDLYFQFYNSPATFDALLTIVVYLSN